MALMGCNLDEVNAFITQAEKVKEKIYQDEKYRSDILDHGRNYDSIKKYLLAFTSLLQYSHEANCESFYRVRRLEGGIRTYR